VGAVVAQSGVDLGVVTVFVPGSTAAIGITGDEPAGPSETVPVRDGQLELGARQRIVLVDRADGPRERTVLVRVID
jgi:thiamine phosphate synthase YjbQ (UPF0047 family)